MGRTQNGRPRKILTVIDEYSRECLAIVVDRKIKSDDVLYWLSDLFLLRCIPEHVQSDNGPEFTAKVVRNWLERMGVRTLFIEPGSPWENGYNESFNLKLRDAKVIIKKWRQDYNTVRPHSSLGYRPPAPEAKMFLHFNPFWESYSKKNIAQALT